MKSGVPRAAQTQDPSSLRGAWSTFKLSPLKAKPLPDFATYNRTKNKSSTIGYSYIY